MQSFVHTLSYWLRRRTKNIYHLTSLHYRQIINRFFLAVSSPLIQPDRWDSWAGPAGPAATVPSLQNICHFKQSWAPATTVATMWPCLQFNTWLLGSISLYTLYRISFYTGWRLISTIFHSRVCFIRSVVFCERFWISYGNRSGLGIFS